jgi:hypothetical protein
VGRPTRRARREPLVEFFGGYAYVRLAGSNVNGGLGSFGWNVTPWLQVVADTSYNFVTASGTKNVLYGNHFGPRAFYRMRNRWAASPFIEALFGGSRMDTTVTGVGGSKSSANGFSIKAGGGLDIKLSPHFSLRLVDFDYYRLPFISGQQNNFGVSTGILLRFLGGGGE